MLVGALHTNPIHIFQFFISTKMEVKVKQLFEKLLLQKSLTIEESYSIFKKIMENEISPIQASAFLSILKMKGEQVSEIIGAVKLLREKAEKINIKGKKVGDTCGTGGDRSETFNISTAAGIVGFGAGLTIAKHGNRAITSKCGSADVMEKLGFNINIPIEKNKEILEKFGFSFFFAPFYHPAMKNIAPVRKDLPFRTIFNIIGPLTNPVKTSFQIMGVSEYKLLYLIPPVFKNLNIDGFVFFSEDGIDEISLTGKTFIVEINKRGIREYEIYPQNFGMKKCSINDLKGGTPDENKEIIMRILQNKEKGAKRDIVILNSAFLLNASGKVDNIKEGIELSKRIIEKGIAYKKFMELVENLQKL